MCNDLSEACGDHSNEDTTVIILTDGAENASQTTKLSDIRKLIDEKQKLGWTFVFLGANQDAIIAGKNLGINQNSCCTYNSTPGGLGSALRCTSEAIERSKNSEQEIQFTQEERNETINS